AASGILLLGCAVGALLWANVHPQSYRGTFDYPLSIGSGGSAAHFTLRRLINDGLMAIFFSVVGMEIKSELVIGELNSIGTANLPAVAAPGRSGPPPASFLPLDWSAPRPARSATPPPACPPGDPP